MTYASLLRLIVLLVSLGATSAWAEAAEIVAAKVLNLASSDQTEVPITFGQVFRPGDVPEGEGIMARAFDGAPIALQVDRKATHLDGSLRHAVLTALLPRLGTSETVTLSLSSRPEEPNDPPVQLGALFTSPFSAQVSLQLDGKTYTADAKDFLQQASLTEKWLSGPLVSEWIVGGPLTDQTGNLHPHLAAYFHVRAYAGGKRVRLDAVIENGWTFVKNPRAFTYDATITMGGREVYHVDALKHYHHTRWHKQFWWGREVSAYVQQDTEYLQATGALPNYPALRPSEEYLNEMLQTSKPMSHGELTQYFPTTGAQYQIGPLPRWAATYAVSADRRAFNSMLANDDDAGSYSVHYRDENTGRPVSIGDHPELTTQFDEPEVNGGIPVPGDDNPNVADQAHQPSIGFVSYLVTGDYVYLEEMQFWTSWNHLSANPLPPYGYRQGTKGIFGVQVRGQAWSLRNLAQAAYATPDAHPYKPLLSASVRHNLEHNEALYSSNPSANQLGALRSYDGYDELAPWMDDFYTWTMGYLVDLGFDAVAMRDWKARFPVGRMGIKDYCYIKAAVYELTVGLSNDHWWPDFATLYRENFGAIGDCPPGAELEGYADSPTGYPSNLRPALAVAVDARIPGAKDAWHRLMTSAVQPVYSDYPNWAVMPRQEIAEPLSAVNSRDGNSKSVTVASDHPAPFLTKPSPHKVRDKSRLAN